MKKYVQDIIGKANNVLKNLGLQLFSQQKEKFNIYVRHLHNEKRELLFENYDARDAIHAIIGFVKGILI